MLLSLVVIKVLFRSTHVNLLKCFPVSILYLSILFFFFNLTIDLVRSSPLSSTVLVSLERAWLISRTAAGHRAKQDICRAKNTKLILRRSSFLPSDLFIVYSASYQSNNVSFTVKSIWRMVLKGCVLLYYYHW